MRLLVFIIAVLSVSTLAVAPQGRFEGPFRVLAVTDGDTIVLKQLGTVRLIGVDAPESSLNPRVKQQAQTLGISPEALLKLASQSTLYAQSLLEQQLVWVEFDVQRQDRYGRLLAYLYLADPAGDWVKGQARYRQLNLEMLRAGWADIYTLSPNVRYAKLFVQAAQQARVKKIGLWIAPTPAGLWPGETARRLRGEAWIHKIHRHMYMAWFPRL